MMFDVKYSSVSDPDSGAVCIRIRRIWGLKKIYNVKSTQNNFTFYFFLMIKWYNYEIITFYFQIRSVQK